MSIQNITDQPNTIVRAGQGPGIIYNRDPSRPLYIGENGSIVGTNLNHISIIDPLSSLYVAGDADVWAVADQGTTPDNPVPVDYIHSGRSQMHTSHAILSEPLANAGTDLSNLNTGLQGVNTSLQNIATLLEDLMNQGGGGVSQWVVLSQSEYNAITPVPGVLYIITPMAVFKDSVRVWPVVTGAYETEVLADNPLGYWRFTEPAGASLAADWSPNGNNASYGSAVARDIGPVAGGNAAVFNGTTQSTIAIPSSLIIPGSSDLSYELWWRGAFATQIAALIFGPSSRINFYGAPFIQCFRWGTVTTQTAIIGNNDAAQITVTGRFNNVLWNHIVCTFDSSSVNMYLNGVPATTAPVTSFAPTANIAGGTIASGLVPGVLLQGSLAEIAVYDQVLSASRVAAHYAASGATP